jgi:hypothetical protein
LELVLFMTLKKATRSEDKAWSESSDDTKESPSGSKTELGAGPLYDSKKSQADRRRVFSMTVKQVKRQTTMLRANPFYDSEESTRGPKTRLGTSRVLDSKEEPSGPKTKHGVSLLHD